MRALFLFFLLFLPFSVYSQELPINSDPIALYDDEEVFLDTKESLFVKYKTIRADGSRDLFVSTIDDKTGAVAHSVRIDFEALKPLFSRLMALEDGRVLLFSHVKANDGSKYLYLMESKDRGRTFSQRAVLNSMRDVLNPFTVAQAGPNIYAVWIDERIPRAFGLYLNYSNDNGVAFKDKDILLTEGFDSASLPTLIAEGNEVHFFFSGTGKDRPAGIYYRYSKDRGHNWSEAVRVTKYDANWQPADIRAIRAKDGTLMVFWYGRGIHLASSRDGTNWREAAILPSSDDGNFVFRMRVFTKGSDIYMLYSNGLLEYAYVKEGKPSIYLLRSSDNGLTWGQPEDIRRYRYSSTSAFGPDMAFGGAHAVAVWQDHRNIRGGVFVNYSEDGGITWQKESLAIEANPGRFHSSSPRIISRNDDYYVFYGRARDDARTAFDGFIKKIGLKELLKDKKGGR